MRKPWSQEEALQLCRQIEMIAPLHNCHVALTGGCLYKTGGRKDLDLVFYRIRQAPHIEITGLFAELEQVLGIKRTSGWGWCIKAESADGRAIDCFIPEESRVDDPLREEGLAEEYADA